MKQDERQAALTQARLRIILLLIWSASLLICVVGLLALPNVRIAIGADQVLESVKSLTAIWVPVLTCLTTFWFGTHEARQRSQSLVVLGEQWAPAIGITFMYVSLITFLVFWVGYGIDYSAPEFGGKSLGEAASFNGKINTVVQWAGMLSPFGTAPVIWLSGKGVNRATGRSTPRSRSKAGDGTKDS
jgi:hypothetical protein